MGVALGARRSVGGQPPMLALAMVVLVTAAAFAGATAVRGAAPLRHATSSTAGLSSAYAALPLSFAPNRGEAAPGTDFVANASGLHIALSPNDATTSTGGNAIDMHLANANASAQPRTYTSLPGKVNYFIGSDPSRWASNLPTYSRVGYSSVYPGIDVAYHGAGPQLEYDFTVAPDADPSVIALTFSGVKGISINRNGELVLDTRSGPVVQRAPHLYQQLGSSQHTIAGSFALRGNDAVIFDVGAYDHTRPLVIDPSITYSTYLGGSGNEEGGYDIAVNSAGDAYVAGGTANPGVGGGSTDFPVTAGAFQTTSGGGATDAMGDAYVSELNPSGTALIYSTYIGGSSFDDSGGLVVDAQGHAYVRGDTQSSDFPTTSGAFQTAPPGPSFNLWVAELSADGSALLYSTYLGGRGFSSGSGLAVDGSGNAYVTGITGAPDFPTTPGAFDRNFHGKANFTPPPFSDRPQDYDAFVSKLTPDGKHLAYSTLLGGNRLDAGFGIAVDSLGNAFVTGDTNSPSFPATPHAVDKNFNGQTDAFVAEVNPTGSDLVYATFLGGRGFDEGISIAIDGSDNAYITGSTASADFPTTPGAYQQTFRSTLAPPPQPCTPIAPPPCGPRNAYVAKIDSSGSTLVYSTYIGGSVFDFGQSIALDGDGAAYISGGTFSPDFPTTSGAPQRTIGGNQDAIVSKLSPDGSTLDFSTFLGGSDFDQGVGIAVLGADDVFVTGATSSSDFPVTPNTFQPTLNGPSNGFVTEIDTG